MFRAIKILVVVVGLVVGEHLVLAADNAPSAPVNEAAIPTEWTDPATGYRLANADDGDQMVFYGETATGMQLFTLNLKTLDIRQLSNRPGRIRGEIVSQKRREAFYQYLDKIYAVNIDTGHEHEVATLPDELPGWVSTINSDGTLLAGTFAKGRREILEKYPRKSDYFERIFEANLPAKLFTIDIATGKVTIIHEEKAWLNHLQFSPTDPKLLMYCHEGPWHKLHRIWLINVETRATQKIHERTVDREIAGHEFWSPDGQTIWFDLQIPRGETFFLAGYDLATARETRYGLTRNEWSVHYNISPDETLFCGDGGDRTSVAQAADGKWLHLFEPSGNKLRSTRLASLNRHDYDLEPNTHFSPDGRWIIFRSNMHGVAHIYALALK